MYPVSGDLHVMRKGHRNSIFNKRKESRGHTEVQLNHSSLSLNKHLNYGE